MLRAPAPLRIQHDRAPFESGSEPLDTYLKQRASQDARCGITQPYVIADHDLNVIGYHTLTSASIDLADLPPSLANKLPRHGTLGATLIDRLAVDRKYQRQGIGAMLVADAVERALHQNPTGTIAVVVDAIDDAAVAFYQTLGFILLPEPGRRLFPSARFATASFEITVESRSAPLA